VSRIGIIGGSGLTSLADLKDTTEHRPETPFGQLSAPVLSGRMGGREFFFLVRHGEQHNIAPHRVNYRANIWALKELGVERLLAFNTVGGIKRSLQPPCVALPNQIVDYTWGRNHTFFDAPPGKVEHVDFTRPYCDETRALILSAAGRVGIELIDGGTYGVTQGPRLESAAEIDRMDRDGCDYVGMTGMPEAALARELKLKYACCVVVVNMAAGRGSGIHDEIYKNLKIGIEHVHLMLKGLVEL
jgi:5'-methylthioinosine phosphorylase